MVLLKGNRCIVLLVVVLALVVLFAGLTVAREDPELRQCKHQCKQQRQFDSRQRSDCERSCEEYIREKERRESEVGKGGEEEWDPSRRRGTGREEEEEEGRGKTVPWRREEPEKGYRKCRERCQDEVEGRRAQQLCESDCEERYRRERDQNFGRSRRSEEEEEEEDDDDDEEIGGKSGKPYVFNDHHFSTKLKSEEGRVRVLKRFNKRSKHLKGIGNYRLGIFEANPQTFLLPNHWDADALFFVAQGEGTVSLVYTDRKESFNIERGHVVFIPAGVTAYLINRGNNEKLVFVKLIIPVSNPGKFESFFGVGGQDSESYFDAFSSDILGAAFKTSGDRLKSIFSQRRGGFIVKASEEQIRALTHDKGSSWPFGGKGSKESGPLHLFRQHPKEANEFGKLFEVDLDDYKRLRDLNVAISFANITQGSMHTPFYNSRVTKIAVVVNGRGYFEMACPHVSKSGHKHKEHHGGRSSYNEENTDRISYKKINSELKQGMVFVVPPGHPFVTLASEDENLEVICFEINAENNHKFPLAGQKNIWKNLEREAKELAFETPVEEVERVFESQDEEFFFPGPRQQERRQGYSII